MSALDFFDRLDNDYNFRTEIINIFENSTYGSVYWEFPPFCFTTKNNLAEFVLVKADKFPKYNESAFREHFVGKKPEEIISFLNISGDTNLISVVPSNNIFNKYCSDISAFMCNVSVSTKHNLLKKIGKEMLKHKNSNRKTYLSTHGRGVPWLHVRICNSPKYYSNEIYTRM